MKAIAVPVFGGLATVEVSATLVTGPLETPPPP